MGMLEVGGGVDADVEGDDDGDAVCGALVLGEAPVDVADAVGEVDAVAGGSVVEDGGVSDGGVVEASALGEADPSESAAKAAGAIATSTLLFSSFSPTRARCSPLGRPAAPLSDRTRTCTPSDHPTHRGGVPPTAAASAASGASSVWVSIPNQSDHWPLFTARVRTSTVPSS
ncbi:hypothetical protein ABZ883_30040 [Streptomyces sp. NPDC046977]|uniref:hypothetical protein n=1 Tax=Streptomyces sp. NPDC046977 TaxID=3154703 RepID=UPI0033DBECBD